MTDDRIEARYWQCTGPCGRKYSIYGSRYTGDRCENCVLELATTSTDPLVLDLVKIVGKWSDALNKETQAWERHIQEVGTYREGYEDGRREHS